MKHLDWITTLIDFVFLPLHAGDVSLLYNISGAYYCFFGRATKRLCVHTQAQHKNQDAPAMCQMGKEKAEWKRSRKLLFESIDQ